MTQNQIAFYKAREERRHNMRTESQTDTSLGESIRHNKASESINWYSAKTGAAVGFAQAAAAQAQAAAANKQADVAAQRAEYDYDIGLRRNTTEYSKMLMENQINWRYFNEQKRHNMQMEKLQGGSLVIEGVNSTLGNLGNFASSYAKMYPYLR